MQQRWQIDMRQQQKTRIDEVQQQQQLLLSESNRDDRWQVQQQQQQRSRSAGVLTSTHRSYSLRDMNVNDRKKVQPS